MKRLRILTYITSSFLLLSVSLTAQNETDRQTDSETTSDSISAQPRKFGIRVGIDASKLVRTALDDDYTGFEVVADYRFSRKYFISAELGNENKDFITDFLNITTKGTYFYLQIKTQYYLSREAVSRSNCNIAKRYRCVFNDEHL